MNYNGIEYLTAKRFIEDIISKSLVSETDTVFDLLNSMELYDNKNMITGEELSGNNNREFQGGLYGKL